MTIYKQTIQTEIQLRVVVACALFRITNPPVSSNTVTPSLSETGCSQMTITRQINNRSQTEATIKREQVPNVTFCWIPIQREGRELSNQESRTPSPISSDDVVVRTPMTGR